ncbi:hypothetical protein [Streptomyces sp. 6N106]|uniref:hypothetical protein n=1 Tax=Streptomyces sp. 6N106 TaxID=3457418 RepID=UPI003FCF43A4
MPELMAAYRVDVDDYELVSISSRNLLAALTENLSFARDGPMPPGRAFFVSRRCDAADASGLITGAVGRRAQGAASRTAPC